MIKLASKENVQRVFELSQTHQFEGMAKRFEVASKRIKPIQLKLKADYNKFKAVIEAQAAKTPVHIKAILEDAGFKTDPFEDPGSVMQKWSNFTKETKTAKESNDKYIISQEKVIQNLKKMGKIPTFDTTGLTGGALKLAEGHNTASARMEEIKKFRFKPGTEDLKEALAVVNNILVLYGKIDEYQKANKNNPSLLNRILAGEHNKLRNPPTKKELEAGQLDKLGMLSGTTSTEIDATTRSVSLLGDELKDLDAIPLPQVLKFLKNAPLIKEGLRGIAGAVFAGSTNDTQQFWTEMRTSADAVIASNLPASVADALIPMKQLQMEALKVKIGGSSGPVPQKKARGGLIRYYDQGGFTPRGTDTVPAMLTPGEFVVNARSTRKFYSQLVAMNSGSQPVYKATGGPITNNNIGDINVTVDGGQSSVQSAREIATGLRRELRRNTLSLN